MLVSPADPGSWRRYHEIRRHVLFEARGRFGIYDEDHPDERVPGHYPKLLLFRNDPVGVLRIDIEVPDADLRGYDACFFCLGVSSAGMSEADYTRLTFDLTLGWARRLARINPAMAFLYVSGAGTGGTAMWARVKGRTEEALLALFPSAFMVRLGLLRPMHGEASSTRWTRVAYAAFKPLLPLIQAVAPGAVLTSEELGRAMIRAARQGAPKRVLEVADLRALGAPGSGSDRG